MMSGALVAAAPSNANEELLVAAQLGNVAAIQFNLAAGASLGTTSTAQDRRGWTALHFAAQAGHGEAVAALLSTGGADVNASTGASGRTAVHLAAKEGHTEVVLQLLAAGAAADIPDTRGWTALHFAAEGGHTRVLKALLRIRKADPQRTTRDHYSPLQLSAGGSHAAATRVLLEAGAVPYDDTISEAAVADDVRVLAVFIAARSKESYVIKQPEGDWLRCAAKEGRTKALKLLLQAGVQIAGSGALVAAARRGSVKRVQLSLSAGAEIEERYRGTTPLAAAASAGQTAVMRVLLEAGAAVDAGLGQPRGSTALQECGCAAACRLLLDAGAVVEDLQAGYSPLLWAACMNRVSVMEVLLEAGADVWATNPGIGTVLHVAAKNRGVPATRLLLEAGAPVNATDINGRTPLMVIAGYKGSKAEEIMQLLLAAGADLDAADCNGERALHLAPDLAISRYLLAAGAKIDARNARGKTALDQALYWGEEGRARMLMAAGATIPDNALTQALQHIRPRLYGSWLLGLLPSRVITDAQLREWSAAVFPAAAEQFAEALSEVTAGQLDTQWATKEQMCWGVWSLQGRLPQEILRLIAAICCMVQDREDKGPGGLGYTHNIPNLCIQTHLNDDYPVHIWF